MDERGSNENPASKGLAPLPRRILAAVDGSKESLAAAQLAISMAEKTQAEISVLYVVHLPEYITVDVRSRLEKELGKQGETALLTVHRMAKERNLVFYEKMLTTTKSIVTTICNFATSDDAGLIVLGSRGTGGVAELMLGAVAVGVVREARCPVLIVK